MYLQHLRKGVNEGIHCSMAYELKVRGIISYNTVIVENSYECAMLICIKETLFPNP